MVIVPGHITVDLIDPGRINLFEHWASQTVRSASVAEYDIADVRPMSRRGRA